MMMLTIRLSLAQNEREKIAERVAMGQVARARSGKRNTSARPYGYNLDDDLNLFVNEEEAPWVKQIFEWYLSGWGRAKIARTLNEKGVPTNRGLPTWKEKIIGNIVRNITYTGCVHYKRKGDPESKRIIVPNTHEALISMEEYEDAQMMVQRRRDHDMNLSSYTFPFSTIVKCAVCGRSYHGKLKSNSLKNGKKEFHYYRCSGKYRPDITCNESDIVESKIVALLFSYLDNVITQKGLDEERSLTTNHIDAAKERKRIEKKLADSKERRKKWAKAMGEGKMEYEVYSELIDEETRQNELLQQQLAELPEETPTGRKAGDVINTLRNIKTNWYEMSVEQQKRVIQSTFRQIIIGKIEGTWRILGVKLNQ
jgi:site-specific DNA recombinase